jgi:hypothetical protein
MPRKRAMVVQPLRVPALSAASGFLPDDFSLDGFSLENFDFTAILPNAVE